MALTIITSDSKTTGPIPLGGVPNIEFLLQEVRIGFFYFLFVSTSLYALFRGGAPERSVIAICVLSYAMDKLLHLFVPVEYAKMDLGHFALDLIGWFIFIAIAIRAKRFWPLWIVALHTITMAAHSAKLVDISIHPRAYLTMQSASSFPAFVIIAIGVYQHQRRLKANGSDPSWRVK